jgi:hypothetical protein
LEHTVEALERSCAIQTVTSSKTNVNNGWNKFNVLKNDPNYGFGRGYAPYSRDVESQEKNAYVKRFGPAFVAAVRELETNGGVIHPTLAKAAAQFLKHQQFVVDDTAARAERAQRAAALQEGMNRVEHNLGAQPQGGERITENLVPPNQIFEPDNAQLRQAARAAVTQDGNGIGDLGRTPPLARTGGTPSTGGRGGTARMTDNIGEIHQGADAVRDVMQIIRNVRADNNQDGPKRKLEERRREREDCITSLERQSKRLKCRIDTSNLARTEKDVATIERIEDQIDILSDEVVAINMQITEYTYAEGN